MSIVMMGIGFVATVLAIVAIHEYGHFRVATLCGIHVEKFSLGFGAPLYERPGRNGFKFVVGRIPLGGYIMIKDEYDYRGDDGQALKGLREATLLQRMAVLLAGPVANLVLAVVIFAGLSMAGQKVLKPTIGEVDPTGLFALAGFSQGDLIVKIDGAKTMTREQVIRALTQPARNNTYEVTIRGNNGLAPERVLRVAGLLKPLGPVAPVEIPERFGFSFWAPSLPPVVGAIQPGSAAERAGIQLGDRIDTIDNLKIKKFSDVTRYIETHPETALELGIVRQGESVRIGLVTGSDWVNGKQVGKLGVAVSAAFQIPSDSFQIYRAGFSDALVGGAIRTYTLVTSSLSMIKRLVKGEESVTVLSGTVGLVEYSGKAASRGVSTFIAFIAAVSISVGVFNLLPIPGLDGGQLLFQVIDKIAGGRAATFYHTYAIRFGVACVVALFIITLYNDLGRVIRY